MRDEKVLERARFDPKLPHYWMIGVIAILSASVIGLPLVPLWLLFGWRVHRKQYERMECELTERTLNIRRGLLFRVEKNIPLDKIQDLAVKEGPILRYLGLSALAVETAGQSSPQGGSDANLTGVVDAPAFRDAVLNQRDLVVERLSGSGAPIASSAGGPGDSELLQEIRDSLHRIEELIARAGQRESSSR